jgi:hypothetical protein
LDFYIDFDSSATFETEQNQARLEYYNGDPARIKYDSTVAGTSYWLASPGETNVTTFCVVFSDGSDYSWYAFGYGDFGCAPAFCVK